MLESCRSKIIQVVFVVIFAASSHTAAADEWDITPSIRIGEAYTDNVDLEPDNTKSDFITSVQPGVRIDGSGRRFLLNLDYSLEALFFAKDSDNNELRHHLGADGSAELVEDVLFMDASAFITEAIISSADAQSASGITGTQNLTTAYGYRLSPSLRHAFGDFGDWDMRYSLRHTIFDTDEVSDTVAHVVATHMTSGERFSRFLWDGTLSGEFAERSSGPPTNRQLAVGTLQYVLMPAFIPLVSLGYERIEDETLSDEPNGPIGLVGFRSAPNPRLSLQATFGWRFERPNLGFDFRYEPSSRTAVTASYVEGIETTSRLAGEALNLLAVDEDGDFIDLHTGLPFELLEPGFGLSDDAFFRRHGEVNLLRSSGRNDFNTTVFGETRETDTTGETERVLGARFNWSRSLSQRTRASLSFQYSNTDFDTAEDRIDDLLGVRAGINYRLAEYASASLAYVRTMRLSTVEEEEFEENLASVYVRFWY